jgi:hypothetical protein
MPGIAKINNGFFRRTFCICGAYISSSIYLPCFTTAGTTANLVAENDLINVVGAPSGNQEDDDADVTFSVSFLVAWLVPRIPFSATDNEAVGSLVSCQLLDFSR